MQPGQTLLHYRIVKKIGEGRSRARTRYHTALPLMIAERQPSRLPCTFPRFDRTSKLTSPGAQITGRENDPCANS